MPIDIINVYDYATSQWATQQVNGKWQFWGRQNSVTPEPID